MNDAVNNPKHYTSDPSGIECIEITRHRNFNVGNAIKYLWRAGLKDSDATVQDLQKAVWYINDEIERLKKFDNAPKASTFLVSARVEKILRANAFLSTASNPNISEAQSKSNVLEALKLLNEVD